MDLAALLRKYPGQVSVGSPAWVRQQTGHMDSETCACCGGPLPTILKGGDPDWSVIHGNRETCSNKCRQKVYRLRLKAPKEEPPMKQTPHKSLLLRLSPQLVQALKAQARREDRSVTWIVQRDLAAIYLKKGRTK